MDYKLILKDVMNENRKRFLKSKELMKTDVKISKRHLIRLLKYFDNVFESGDRLKNLLDNPRFVNKLRHYKDKNLFCIDKQGKPIFYSEKELETECNLKIKQHIELLKGDFEKYFNEEIPLNKISCPVKVVKPKMRLLYREVVKDTAGNKYLLELTLNYVITQLIENHKDLSAESLLIDSECKIRDENNKHINCFDCFDVDKLKKTLFFANSVSCIYKTELLKIGEGKLKNYDVFGDLLRPIPLPDEELFALFEGIDLKPNKSAKNKNKTQKPQPIQLLQLTEQKITEEIEDDTITYISSDSDTENSSDEVNKIEPIIQAPIFNVDFGFNATQQELCNITEMLYNLYDENDNFCIFITDNNYYTITIIKGLHYDTNQQSNSLHFTGIMTENITNKPTKPYHFYIKNGAIVSITEIRNVI